MIVAIAGGTGDIGSTVVDELVSAGKHDVVVLSRKVCVIARSGDYGQFNNRRAEDEEIDISRSSPVTQSLRDQDSLSLITTMSKC